MGKVALRPFKNIYLRFVIAIGLVAVCSATASVWPLPPRQPGAYEVVETAAIVESPTTVGVAATGMYNMNQHEIDKTLDALQSIGVQDIRIVVPWAYVEPRENQYVWTNLDRVVNSAESRGMGIVATVTATPLWAGVPISGHPSSTVFGDFTYQLATRYA